VKEVEKKQFVSIVTGADLDFARGGVKPQVPSSPKVNVAKDSFLGCYFRFLMLVFHNFFRQMYGIISAAADCENETPPISIA